MGNEMAGGRFIVIDGSEGAGKTTQMQRIHDWLTTQNVDVWLTREPGGTAIGEHIRDILLNPINRIDPDTELLLLMAARRQHLSEAILPRLERGQWVLCDRFNDATYAYQGYARGIDLKRIATLEQWAMPNIEPDLRLIMTVDPAIAQQRLAKRNRTQDRFEQEREAFFTAVAAGYQARSQAANARLINANGDSNSVFAEIRAHLTELL